MTVDMAILLRMPACISMAAVYLPVSNCASPALVMNKPIRKPSKLIFHCREWIGVSVRAERMKVFSNVVDKST